MKNIVIKILLACALIIALAESVAAGTQKSNDTISIFVTVSEVTAVSITPDSLTWTGVSPGSVGAGQAILIENIGSTNITKVWLNNSYPGSLPYGSSNFALHNAGNFVVVRRNISNAQWFHPNLVEYNESELIYLTLPASTVTHGRYRGGNKEYFWAMVNGTTGGCTNATFFIGVAPHNSSQQGTIDLSACTLSLGQTGTTGCRTGSVTSYNATWGYADVMVGMDDGVTSIGLNYSLMVKNDCTQVFFYKWNQDMATAGSTANDLNFSSSTIYPGGNLIANVNVEIPYGVPSGQKTGGLTVFVEAVDST